MTYISPAAGLKILQRKSPKFCSAYNIFGQGKITKFACWGEPEGDLFECNSIHKYGTLFQLKALRFENQVFS